jgi:probable rRNA maturation factor
VIPSNPSTAEPDRGRQAQLQAVELDLAFQLDPAPATAPAALAALCNRTGALADSERAALTWQKLLASWLGQLRAELPDSLQADAYSLGLTLVDDAGIAALNGDWRNRREPTDVLAFAALDEALGDAPPMPQPPGDDCGESDSEPLELGDIVISLETAARQAEEHGHDLERELLFLASHGLLHLLGWDHPDEARLAAMLARQEALLERSEPLP